MFGGPNEVVPELGGDGRAVPLRDGGWAWAFAPTLPNHPSSPMAAVPPSSIGQECDLELGGAISLTPLFDMTTVTDGALLSALDGVVLDDGAALYFARYLPDPAEFFGVRLIGYGVAFRDPDGDVYQPQASLLFTADRPSYGSAALRVGDWIYAFGCRPADAFQADCFVARVPVDQMGNETAYHFYRGGGEWTSNADEAGAIASANAPLSVRWDELSGLYLMTYVPPLSSELTLRTAQAPEGPWSEARVLARCKIPDDDPGAVCTGGLQHPERGAALFSLSYGVVSLSDDAPARMAAAPTAYWPRLVELDLP